MDFNALVDEIVTRVAQKMDGAAPAGLHDKVAAMMAGEEPEEPAAEEEKAYDGPKLLVLTQCHGTHCHQMLESKRLVARYVTECALAKEYNCDIAEYDVIILYNLSCEALTKIAEGAGDTPFTSLAVRAILMGKKIVAVREDVELYDYKGTAPAVYYGMMMEKIKLLEHSGVVFCDRDCVEDVVMGSEATVSAAGAKCETPQPPQECCSEPAPQKCCEVTLTKKVITEKDVTAAHGEGASVIRVSAKAIVTELAKDYAHERRIEIIKG